MPTKALSLYGLIVILALLGCGGPSRIVKEPKAPPPPGVKSPSDVNNALFRFAVYGDTRTNDAVHREIVKEVMDANPDFILQTGDLVQFSAIRSQWRRFDQITKPIRDRHIPYYPSRGNHDVAGTCSYLNEVRDKFESGNKLYYRFDSGNLRFIALDTASPLADTASPQYLWLEQELQLAKKENKFVVPFFHEAIFSVGTHAGENRKLRSVLHPLFKAYGVKVVFQGHDHLYYRTRRDDITYVVTGGGGAPLYAVRPELMEKGDVARSIHHFCLAQVFPDRIEVSVFARTTQAAGMNKIDEFSIPLGGQPKPIEVTPN
jgi:acid phosphatase type 7